MTSGPIGIEEVAGATQDPIIVADERGMISFANGAALRLFRFTDSPVGLPITALMPERFVEHHERSFRRLRETGNATMTGKTLSAFGLRQDGTEFPCHISLNSWRCTEGELCVVAVIKDISATAAAREHVKAIAEGREPVIVADGRDG